MNHTASSAKVLRDQVVCSHSVRADVGREYLEVEAPAGWDDVQKLVGKVLEFDGRKFVYLGWNSDRNVAYFGRSLYDSPVKTIARIL